VTVLTAHIGDNSDSMGQQQQFEPVAIETAVAEIQSKKPAVVFAPHVETAAGLMLPDDYIKQLADAVHSVGGLLVIDCIASGCVWLDMKALGIDV
ncbi:alanine--glyoxylate aminotransferase family protein, partial [Mycobacterium tuberculosis]|nr:alanine--glyoxylate aminotransferase family protein [Mycobacterium tuberculosis]